MKISACLVVIWFLISVPATARAEGIINWPYFTYPPVFILSGNKIDGFGVDIKELLASHMTEYEHRLVQAAPARVFDMLRKGGNYCPIAITKTPAREGFIQYSIPCCVVFNYMVVFRREDADRLGAGRDISLVRLLEDKSLRFGYLVGINYGPIVDDLLNKHRAAANWTGISGPGVTEQLLRMVLEKRLDGMLGEPLAVNYLSQKFGAVEKLTIIPIRERKALPRACYIGAPKNDWGRRVITRIDDILRREIRKERFMDYQDKWIPESLKSEFRERYDSLVFQPALHR